MVLTQLALTATVLLDGLHSTWSSCGCISRLRARKEDYQNQSNGTRGLIGCPFRSSTIVELHDELLSLVMPSSPKAKDRPNK